MSRADRLRRMFNPRSAVFVGGSVIEEAIVYCRDMGFQGPICVVNPFHQHLAGVRCHAAIEDLPQVPDIAYVGTPRSVVCETLAALSRAGVGGAVCNSAGFSELQGEGVALQQAFVDAAGDMPVIGPNCLGFANFLDNAAFMQGFSGDHSGVERGVAVISNGGAYVSDLGCADRSLPVAFQAGLGNQAMVTMAEVMDLVLDDDRVLAVNLYFEALHDVARLSRCALKAARKGIPVVAVKGGRHEAGRRAAQTHTASLAGDGVVASALFRRFGFVEADNAIEAIETLKFLVFAGTPRGNRTAFTTSSGSYAVLGGDAAEAEGLAIEPLGEKTRQSLAELLPSYVLPSNPLDISNGQYFETCRLEAIFDAFLDEGFDIALQVMCFPPPGGWDPATWHANAEAFARQARRHGLSCAFVATLPEGLPPDARASMIANGMAPLMGIDHGIKAVANGVRCGSLARVIAERRDGEILIDEIPEEHGETYIPHEADAKGLLAGWGIAVPGSVVVRQSDDTTIDIAGPVAVKALVTGLLHKSETGALALNVPDEAGVRRAMSDIDARLREGGAGLAPEGFLVEEMVVDGVAEMLIGVRRVAGVGLTLTLAVGGVAVELVRDATTVMLPASRSTLSDALRSLRLFPLLDGWRGRMCGDVEAALDAIEGLCALAARDPRIIDLEVNPLLIRPQGLGVAALDAVLRLTRAPEA